MDLSVPNLMDDIIHTPTSIPNSKTTRNHVQEEVDLFADATFQSVTSNSETTSVQVWVITYGFSCLLHSLQF